MPSHTRDGGALRCFCAVDACVVVSSTGLFRHAACHLLSSPFCSDERVGGGRGVCSLRVIFITDIVGTQGVLIVTPAVKEKETAALADSGALLLASASAGV